MRTRTIALGIIVALAPTALADAPAIAPLPKAVSSFGAATLDGFVYAYGGHAGKTHVYSTDDVLGTFARLSCSEPSKWETLPSGPILQGLALVAHGGKLYRIGGMQPRNKSGEESDTISVADVSCFDPKTKKWTESAPLPEPRSSHDAIVLGDTIYVFGGWNLRGKGQKGVWHTTALRLDLSEKEPKWVAFEQPFKRRALTVAAINGKLYVVAGLSDFGTALMVNTYDPAMKAWSQVADLPGEKGNGFTPAACVVNGRLYVTPMDGKIYRLNEAGVTWDSVGKLEKSRVVHRMVPFGTDQMLVIGGASRGTNVDACEVVTVK